MWLSNVLIVLVRVIFGVSPHWVGSAPLSRQSVYFANHSSHVDILILWSALPPDLRKAARPVAAADYWNQDSLRRYVARRGLNAVFMDRKHAGPKSNPLTPLYDALDRGHSLIIFPEGTRNSNALPDLFKPGLFHLALHRPDVALVPVYLENVNRCMPKGTVFPVPLICTVRFGSPLERIEGERKAQFLKRARNAVLALR